jgi:DNA-binding XRE family transcriptional regulator
MDLTQEELAQLLGISRVSVVGYETGKQCPALDQAVQLAEILDLSLDALKFPKEGPGERVEKILSSLSPGASVTQKMMGLLKEAHKEIANRA